MKNAVSEIILNLCKFLMFCFCRQYRILWRIIIALVYAFRDIRCRWTCVHIGCETPENRFCGELIMQSIY